MADVQNPYVPDSNNPYASSGPYVGDVDDNDELDAAAPRRAHRSFDSLPQVPLADEPPSATPAQAWSAVDPDATVMAPASDTGATAVPADGATTVAARPGATTVTPGAATMVNPGAATRVTPGGATTVNPGPATVARPQPATVAQAPNPYASPGGTVPPSASRTQAHPAAAVGPSAVAVDAHRAEMARRLMDADRGLYDDYDEGFGGAAKGGVMGERFLRSQHEKLRGTGRRQINPKRLRFWRWFRALPILLMVLALALSWFFSEYPVASIGRVFFPVSDASAIEQAASDYGVDPDLVAAVIKSESNWDAGALSAVGATGLMQVMPSTARDLAARGIVDASVYDPSNLTDPATNLEYGTAYLAQLLESTGSTEEAIAAYNAGPAATTSWKSGASDGDEFSDLIQYPETASYLKNVMSAYEQYQRLYPNGLSAS